jgi:hypothetical protein
MKVFFGFIALFILTACQPPLEDTKVRISTNGNNTVNVVVRNIHSGTRHVAVIIGTRASGGDNKLTVSASYGVGKVNIDISDTVHINIDATDVNGRSFNNFTVMNQTYFTAQEDSKTTPSSFKVTGTQVIVTEASGTRHELTPAIEKPLAGNSVTLSGNGGTITFQVKMQTYETNIPKTL